VNDINQQAKDKLNGLVQLCARIEEEIKAREQKPTWLNDASQDIKQRYVTSQSELAQAFNDMKSKQLSANKTLDKKGIDLLVGHVCALFERRKNNIHASHKRDVAKEKERREAQAKAQREAQAKARREAQAKAQREAQAKAKKQREERLLEIRTAISEVRYDYLKTFNFNMDVTCDRFLPGWINEVQTVYSQKEMKDLPTKQKYRKAQQELINKIDHWQKHSAHSLLDHKYTNHKNGEHLKKALKEIIETEQFKTEVRNIRQLDNSEAKRKEDERRKIDEFFIGKIADLDGMVKHAERNLLKGAIEHIENYKKKSADFRKQFDYRKKYYESAKLLKAEEFVSLADERQKELDKFFSDREDALKIFVQRAQADIKAKNVFFDDKQKRIHNYFKQIKTIMQAAGSNFDTTTANNDQHDEEFHEAREDASSSDGEEKFHDSQMYSEDDQLQQELSGIIGSAWHSTLQELRAKSIQSKTKISDQHDIHKSVQEVLDTVVRDLRRASQDARNDEAKAWLDANEVEKQSFLAKEQRDQDVRFLERAVHYRDTEVVQFLLQECNVDPNNRPADTDIDKPHGSGKKPSLLQKTIDEWEWFHNKKFFMSANNARDIAMLLMKFNIRSDGVVHKELGKVLQNREYSVVKIDDSFGIIKNWQQRVQSSSKTDASSTKQLINDEDESVDGLEAMKSTLSADLECINTLKRLKKDTHEQFLKIQVFDDGSAEGIIWDLKASRDERGRSKDLDSSLQLVQNRIQTLKKWITDANTLDAEIRKIKIDGVAALIEAEKREKAKNDALAKARALLGSPSATPE